MEALDVRIRIADLYDRGLLAGDCTVNDLVPRVSPSVPRVTNALRRLGFAQVQPKTRSRPAVWRPPLEWPESFEVERRLRQVYALTGPQIRRASADAFGLPEILNEAVDALVVKRVALDESGRLKNEIRRVMFDKYTALRYDNIARRELARWLGEAPDANSQYLENRVKGLIRALQRRSNSHEYVHTP